MGRASPEHRSSDLPVRAFYSVAELARAGNVPAYRLLRFLRRNGIAFMPVGRVFYVMLDEIQQKIPALYRSLLAAEDLRRGADTAENAPKLSPAGQVQPSTLNTNPGFRCGRSV
jgi:hypothetical protein